MRHHFLKKLTALACTLALSLSLIPAAQAAETPAKSSNINQQDYTTYGSTVKSYLYENEDGGLTRVEYIKGTIVAEDYDSGFNFLSSRTIPMELSIWGGFYAGEDYNFLIFGQNNAGENDSTEVIRVVKYSKDWTRLGQASLRGANTVDPFEAGSLRCDEYGGYLYIRTSHKMYTTSDGLNHQSNLTMAVDEKSMTITDSYYDISNSSYGYVSHSFNQFIMVDRDGYIVALDHGDAYPRGVVHTRYYSKADTGKFSGGTYQRWCSCDSIMDFAGAVGNNTTGASIGGLTETSGCYIMAYNYDGVGGSGTRYPYYHYMDKTSGRSWSVKLNYPGCTTPVLASTGLSGGYMLWNGKSGYTANDTLYYMAYGSDGTPSQPKTATASLSDCQPIYYNGDVVWYVTNNSTPTFYTLNSSGVKGYSADGSSASAGTTTTSGTTTTPTAPATGVTGIMTSPNNTFVIPGYNGLYITPDGALKIWYHTILHGKMVEPDYTARTLGTGYSAISGNYLLKEDGTLWHFWDNEVDDMRKLMDDVKQVSNGTILKNDGTVWSIVPLTDGIVMEEEIQYITSGGKQVYGGGDYAYVVKKDGSLWSWGSNESYLLGRNVSGEWDALGKVMDNVAYVTGGMAIKTDGTLWSWGVNGNGQVGNGNTSVAFTPVKIMDRVAGAWSFGSSASYRFALTMDGELYSWGSSGGWNPLGYEGGNDGYTTWEFGTIAYQTVPRKVGVSQVASVYCNGFTTAILKKDGSLWAYGMNDCLPITKTRDGGDREQLTTFTRFLDGVKIPEDAPGQPGTETGNPSGNTSGTTTQNHGTTTQKPGTTTQKPSTTTQKPGTTTQKPAGSSNPFTDVPEGAYYHDAVLWALENNITTGVTATQFQPSAACTRGQVVTFLWRAKGCPEPDTKVNPFKDVSASSPFYKAVLWAYENNITTGTTATTFNPSGTCTSGHVVTFLWRANGKPVAPGFSALANSYAGEYYADAIAWANNSGLLDGTAKVFIPDEMSPRADIVTYLYRDMAV